MKQNIIIGGLVFILVAIVITLISSFYTTDSLIERISSKIYSIIQILFLLGLILTYQSYVDTSMRQTIQQQSTLAENSWLKIYNLIQTEGAKCPHFAQSLTFEWQIPHDFKRKYDLINASQISDNFESVQNISFNIFHSVESVINYFTSFETGENLNLWISSFLIWFNSDILYQNWVSNHIIYDDDTQTLANAIFKYVRQNPPKDVSDIQILSTQICKSPEVQNLFTKRGLVSPCY